MEGAGVITKMQRWKVVALGDGLPGIRTDKPGGADDAGVIAKGGGENVAGGKRLGKGDEPLANFTNFIKQKWAGCRYAAADNDLGGIQQDDEMREGKTEVIGGLVDDAGCSGVPGLGSIDDIFGGQLVVFAEDIGKHVALPVFSGFTTSPDDTGGGGVVFQAAAFAAVAQRTVCRIYSDVADFACHAVNAMRDGTVYYNATADAGAERNHDQIRRASSGTLPHFPESGRIRVVFHEDADTGERLHFGSQLGPLPMEIDRLMNDAAVRVDGAGHPDPDACQLLLGNVGTLQEEFNHFGCPLDDAVCA